MSRAKRNRIAALKKAITDQRKWIDDHGGDVAGYTERYGDEGIYRADMTELQDREKRLRRQEERG